MTATGFLMLIIGTLIHRIFGDPFGDMPYGGDYIAAFLQMGGFVLIIVGIFIWLFKVMP